MSGGIGFCVTSRLYRACAPTTLIWLRQGPCRTTPCWCLPPIWRSKRAVKCFDGPRRDLGAAADAASRLGGRRRGGVVPWARVRAGPAAPGAAGGAASASPSSGRRRGPRRPAAGGAAAAPRPAAPAARRGAPGRVRRGRTACGDRVGRRLRGAPSSAPAPFMPPGGAAVQLHFGGRRRRSEPTGGKGVLRADAPLAGARAGVASIARIFGTPRDTAVSCALRGGRPARRWASFAETAFSRSFVSAGSVTQRRWARSAGGAGPPAERNIMGGAQ